MAKIPQNAVNRGNERQQAAGYAYGPGGKYSGGGAVKPETLGRFPIGPGGVAPSPKAPLPDFAGPWGAGSKKKGGGGGGGGGGSKKKVPTPTPKPQTLPEGNTAPIPTPRPADAAVPTPTPRPDTFSPDLAPSPNPFQMGSPVDARPGIGAFQGPPQPPAPYDALTGRDMLNNPPANPFMNDRDVLAALVAQLTGGGGGTDPTQTGATAAPPVIQPGVASGSSPILGGAPPVVGGSRPVIDVMKLMRGG